MKRIALIITILFVVALNGYFYFEKSLFSEKVNLWDRVPSNTILVYESKDLVERWNHFLETPIWKSLAEAEDFSRIKSNLELLDSIGGSQGHIDRLIKSSSTLISMQVIGKNKFDFTYFIDLSAVESQKIATGILEAFKDGGSFDKRIYQGYELQEISSKGRTFTYLIDKNVFIGSFTPFLVEDVVRLMDGGVSQKFIDVNNDVFQMPKLTEDDGNLYINISNFSQFIGAFQKSDLRKDSRKVSNFGKSIFLDLSINEDKILFNGFTTTEKSDFLNTFKNQDPSSSNLKYFIPNLTATLYRYSFSNALAWQKEVKEYWKHYSKEYLTERNHFEDTNEFKFNDLFAWLGNEVALATVETFGAAKEAKLVYVSAKDINQALNQLNTFSESLAKVEGDSVYVEKFSNLDIRELKIEDFPKYAFGPLFSGFDECYYAVLGDYIVFGNSIQALKQLITDIEGENTWGRSVAFNKFLDSNLEEANVNLIFNTQSAWSGILGDFDPSWREYAQKYGAIFKGFRLGSLQFSRLDDSFYTSLALAFEKQQYIVKNQYFKPLVSYQSNFPLITKPFVVKNHVDNSLETFVQDSAYNVSLISSEGELLWTDSMGQPIISDVEQVDFYKNGKLQYFFATPNRLHIIDRLGNYIDGYPLKVEADRIQFASVVDYDKSKRYRFLIGTERGNLYLYNKEGVALEGWTPRETTGKLATAPFHVRVRGRDCIVAIQQDGNVNVMNRRGEMMKGFPLKLGVRFDTKPFLQYGSDFSKTVLTLLSREGKLIQINLEGKVLKSDQLYQPTKQTSFQLVQDALSKTYLIVRQDLGRVVLINADGEEILSKDYLSSGELKVQFYNFSPDNKIYAITDQQQGFTYIYDQKGELVNAQPLDSEYEIATLFFENNNKYQVYSISDNSFIITEF
ncbi:DUF3352 domain-containing protein [Fulvivirga sediminis]|uniref:DUF3352 domain-containing protein n=1 Tax=Fulvivirga sediminis TaxID=2803949 RepID=A0A937FA91_9BACT|nr:DUF3352 domain-containing protein [Fulvivirga sediminis]MBL3658565.1 hypothetical protein [Fulvivirga sediminis]